MAFGTIGVSKQKGGSVGASGHHNDRTRETPNADPERTAKNRVLIGDDRNVRETVSEIIREHGGRPRRDSVEAVELLLSASHEYFEERDGTISQERVGAFVGQAVKFIEDKRNCGVCAKAVLHMDERTPHIHAHMVPIDPKGRLNATHYLDGRQKMKELHDRYAEYMKPLGLERGREGSRARHQTVKSFYASIEQEVRLEIDHDHVPDPPRVMLTAEATKKYKESVLKAVLEQLKEQVQTLRHQAMLTKDERAHRVEAERRADERVAAVELSARERVATVEEASRMKIAEIERLAAERFANLERSARFLIDENRELRADRNKLLGERNALHEQVLNERQQKFDLSALARERGDRLADIPMPEVMEHLGYDGERRGQAHLYRGEGNVVAMRIERQQAFDSEKRLVCRNSLDLVVHMRQHNEGQETFTPGHALAWLRDEFGEKRAAGAYVVNREQSVQSLFERTRDDREIVRSLHPQDRESSRSQERLDHDSHDRSGGRGFDR